MATKITIRLLDTGQESDQIMGIWEYPDMKPVGSATLLTLLVATAVDFLDDCGLKAMDLLGLEYEYTNDGDPPFHVARMMRWTDIVGYRENKPIVPLEEDMTIEGGTYKGWLLCHSRWIMNPEARG